MKSPDTNTHSFRYTFTLENGTTTSAVSISAGSTEVSITVPTNVVAFNLNSTSGSMQGVYIKYYK